MTTATRHSERRYTAHQEMREIESRNVELYRARYIRGLDIWTGKPLHKSGNDVSAFDHGPPTNALGLAKWLKGRKRK